MRGGGEGAASILLSSNYCTEVSSRHFPKTLSEDQGPYGRAHAKTARQDYGPNGRAHEKTARQDYGSYGRAHAKTAH